MKTAIPALSLIVLIASFESASAGGLLQRLPKDGANANYDLSIQWKERGTVHHGTLAISSIGKAKVKGKPARWIGFTMIMAREGRVQKSVFKVLIPEDQFGSGRDPLEHVVRGSYQHGTKPPRAFKKVTDRTVQPVPSFLGSRLVGAKKLKPERVKTGYGVLKCAGVTGSFSYEYASRNVDVNYRTWLHGMSPFGVAASTITIKESSLGKVRSTFVIGLKLSRNEAGVKKEKP